MSKSNIPLSLRRSVIARAEKCCEYCLLPDIGYLKFHIDHIISEFHGGPTTSENLAYACGKCNLRKGISIGSIIDYGSPLLPYFNPRLESWNEHFSLKSDGTITSKTDVGAVTLKSLDLNSEHRILTRRTLIAAGHLKITK